jgi:HEAT repeat protein
VFQGKRLSEFLEFKSAPGNVLLSEEELAAFGPAGVAWLTYTLEHGPEPSRNEGPLPLDSAPDWLRRWIPRNWGGLRTSSNIDKHFEAALLLSLLGPKAAPAIPALARSLDSRDPGLVEIAATALQDMGSVSWPAVREVLDHGSPQARIALFGNMMDRVGPGERNTTKAELEAEAAPAVALLVKALRDPHPGVQRAAAQAIQDCKGLIDDDDPRYDSTILPLIELLSDRDSSARAVAVAALGSLKIKTASESPRLVALLDDADPTVRFYAVRALSSIEPATGVCLARLRALLHDPDRNCREAAEEALRTLGMSQDDANADGDGTPGP